MPVHASEPPFDKHTLIDTVLNLHPKLAEVFNAHGMACVGCVFSRFHSLADAAAIYNLDFDILFAELLHKYLGHTNLSQD